MSEVLNNLIKVFAFLLEVLFFISGIYVGMASLAVDLATIHNIFGARVWLHDGNLAAAKAWADSAKFNLDHHWRSTWEMLQNPIKMDLTLWRHAISPTSSNARGSTMDHIWSAPLAVQAFTIHNLFYHFAVPVIGGLAGAVIVWAILHPLARSGVAKSLATSNKKIFGKPRSLPRGDGFVLARNVRLDRKGGGNPHVLSIGPSGGSKTASQVIPSLLQLPKKCGAVVVDIKGELYARCSNWLRQAGHKVIFLGARQGRGTGWDPLKSCLTVDDVRELARQLIEAGDESTHGNTGNWNNMSRTALSSYLIQAWVDGLGLADALQSLYADEASGEALIHPAAVLDFRQFESMAGSGNTKGSVLATIQGACQVFLQDQVVGWMACERQLKMEDLRKGAVVFLVSSAADVRATQAIQRVFFTRLFDFLANSQGSDVSILMDEAANLGKVEGFSQALNLLRSAGVGIHAFIQNPSQLQVYGREYADVVINSFGTVCVMAGLRDAANDMARLLGEDEDVKPSYSTQDEKMRAQFSQQRRQAVDGATLRQIRRNQVLIVSGNHKPVLARLKPWYSRFGLLRYRVFPKIFRKDWGRIPAEEKTAFFNRVKKIEPIQIVMPEKKKKEEKGDQGEKPKRKKTVRIDMDDLAGALAPHIQPQMPAPEDDGYADALPKAADPFAGLDLAPADKDPDA